MAQIVDAEQANPAAYEPEADSYTALRLQHASPNHIHATTRRWFIGPIPDGWLKSHRKAWYKQSWNLLNHPPRSPTFSAANEASQRKASGLEGPTASTIQGSGFPQPDDVDDDEGDADETATSSAPAKSGTPPSDSAQAFPSSSRRLKPEAGFKDRRNPRSLTNESTCSFVTAHTEADAGIDSHSAEEDEGDLTSPPPQSFMTAKEPTPPDVILTSPKTTSGDTSPQNPSPTEASSSQRINSTSTTSLLPHDQKPQLRFSPPPNTRGAEQDQPDEDTEELGDDAEVATHTQTENNENPTASKPALAENSQKRSPNPGLVRFDLPEDNIPDDEEQKRSRLFHAARRRSWRRRSGQSKPGEIVKAEKMLVRVDWTQQDLDPNYDENQSMKVETREMENWEEFVVVCREGEDSEMDGYSLQLCKTRVIPVIEKASKRRKTAYLIPLDRRKTKINLYSSLDKTLVIWTPWKEGKAIFILRTRAVADSVEWYTFLRSILGWKRSTQLQITVPDLNVNLAIDDPFLAIEKSQDVAKAAQGDEEATARTVDAERAIATSVIHQCVQALKNSPEWGDVLDSWLKNGKMGLAWKRYDRLEWVHGANEQKMYGTMGMQKTHDLELRPKQHYPTSVKDTEILEEPAPIEGFLIRLTTQQGRSQRLGKMFFKRLYFTTHNQYLCYCRPANAKPPPPPTLALDERKNIPSAAQIVDHTPIIYEVNPYPVKDGKIEWLQHKAAAPKHRHDRAAFQESKRKVKTMLDAEGYINMIHIERVRNVQRGASPIDQHIDSGSDVDFHQEVDDTRREDGKTDSFDDDRTFELVLRNGLVVRLQAYNEQTKKEWMSRLRQLVKYWKLRMLDDMNLFRSVRDSNLKYLRIDEEMESILGQVAQKWEVKPSVASPQLHNMCGISCCRAISIAGTLYYKARRHATFRRCGVILCQGHLLIFHGTLRNRSGKEVPHIQHERLASIDLKECYIYSGLVTQNDLLYQNRTFDSNHPGHQTLPKVWLGDGWTSTDEDTMTTFVIWQPRKRNFFRALEQGAGTQEKVKARLRYVSQLGVPGRSIVFKTRSRAGRDHWVMSIATELERLQRREDLRIVDTE